MLQVDVNNAIKSQENRVKAVKRCRLKVKDIKDLEIKRMNILIDELKTKLNDQSDTELPSASDKVNNTTMVIVPVTMCLKTFSTKRLGLIKIMVI